MEPVSLTALKGLAGLRELNLRSCSRLSNKALTALQVHTELAVLSLEGIRDDYLSDFGLEVLEGMSSLTCLNISHCPKLTKVKVQRLCSKLRLSELQMRGLGFGLSAADEVWLQRPLGVCRLV